MLHHLERGDRPQATRRHLEAAIALLDLLQLHQAAVKADLACRKFRPTGPGRPSGPRCNRNSQGYFGVGA